MRGSGPGPRLEGTAFAALIALLAWAPLPLGSNRGWSEGLLWLAVLGLTTVLLLCNLDRAAALLERLHPGRWALLGLAVWSAVALLQLFPLPAAALSLLSPAAYGHWQATGVPAPWPLSVDPGATLVDGVQSLALLALLALVLLSAASWRRLLTLAVFVLLMAVAEALLGIRTHLATGHGLLPGGPEEGVGGISGTFVNPNHYAGFLQFGLAVGLGLMLLGDGVERSPRSHLARVTDLLLSTRSAFLALLVVLITALFWSGSRGALAAIVLSASVAVTVAVLGRPGSGRGLLLMLPLGMLLSLVWMGPGTLQSKFDAQGLSGNRAGVHGASLAAARDYPLLGAGAGSFRHVLPAYKDARLDLRFYEHAHNDALEELVERGLLGAGALLLGVLAALAQMALALRRRRGTLPRALLTGAFAGVLSLSLHGMVDFNLQIPANAAYFVVLLALGIAASALERSTSSGSSRVGAARRGAD
jgi:O-antigen ligase